MSRLTRRAMLAPGVQSGKTVADWNAHCRGLVPSATDYGATVGGFATSPTLRGQGDPLWNVDEYGHDRDSWAENLFHFAQRLFR